MEEIARTENNWRDDLTSAEPHFNDERTIRSAQPVVPLQTIAKERRRRGLMLVGAFVIACLLGATAAMALIRLRQTRTAAQVNSAQPEDEAATANDSDTPAVEPSSESQSIAQADTSAVEEPKQEKKKPKKHTLPFTITVVTSPSANSGQAQMVDQWEEKRQRRVSRPREPIQNHHPDDLFRIREIFEGPRRPRRMNNP